MDRSRSGDDRLRAEAGRIAVEDGRLDERRLAGRERGVVVLGRDVLDRLAVDVFSVVDAPAADVDRGEAVRGLVVVLGRDVVVLDRDVAVLDRVADVLLLPLAATATGFAVDMVLAAAVSALAAFCMAFVAVFIARIAEDMVFADAVALVAAAVILVAAEVTLVAADDTVLAAAAGVAVLRLAVLRRAGVARAVVDREAVERAVVERDEVLRVDLAAGLLVVVFAPVLRDDAAVLRVARGLALAVLELDGRLAVPLDALRLAVLRAVLAELRRVAARVVD